MLHQGTVLLSGVPGYGFIFCRHGDHKWRTTSERESMTSYMTSVQKGKKREVWIRTSELPKLPYKRHTSPSTKIVIVGWLHCLLERSVPGPGGPTVGAWVKQHSLCQCLVVNTTTVSFLWHLCVDAMLTEHTRGHWRARTRSLRVKTTPPVEQEGLSQGLPWWSRG